jgi:hypothetical protein
VICVLVVDVVSGEGGDVRKPPVGAAVFVLVCMKKWESFGGRTYENRQGSRGNHLSVRLCVNISISSAQSSCCTFNEVADGEDVRKPPGKPGNPPVGAANTHHQQPYPYHHHGIQRNVRNPPGNPGNGAEGRGPAGRLAIHISDALSCMTDGDVRSPGIGATGVPGAWRWTRGAAKALWLLVMWGIWEGAGVRSTWRPRVRCK